MKRFILNCFIFLAGVIGVIGWAIVCSSENAGFAGVVNDSIIFDWIIIIGFAFAAAYGFISARKEIKEDK